MTQDVTIKQVQAILDEAFGPEKQAPLIARFRELDQKCHDHYYAMPRTSDEGYESWLGEHWRLKNELEDARWDMQVMQAAHSFKPNN